MNLHELKADLLQNKRLVNYASGPPLIEIVTGQTELGTAGFPFISDRSFRIFKQNVPHLFWDGQSILEWLDVFLSELKELPMDEEAASSVQRAIKVLQTIAFTAGITAPSDLWILKHVLSAHHRLGTLQWLLDGHTIIPDEYALQHNLNGARLSSDLHFLHARGYVNKGDGDFSGPYLQEVIGILHAVEPIETEDNHNMVPSLVDWLSGRDTSSELQSKLERWLKINLEHQPTGSWIASAYQIELGYRLMPLVLALRVMDLTSTLVEGQDMSAHVASLIPEMTDLFTKAGLLEKGAVTRLGARVFERGPGPFGIIGAYHTYLDHLEELLTESADVKTWVQRGENVVASQDANRKTFQLSNDKLDDFCRDYDYDFSIFIEHAVGQGEAIRQRFERDGENEIRYFGADLEPTAIVSAIQQQQDGQLPQNLEFICPADIGDPPKVIDHLTSQGLENDNTVLMVGNGFHEIRNQTNEKMIEVFSAYQEAGYLLIFTEESALSDEALLQTAWNTYHAGFRYVHELSGQGLRPARGSGVRSERWSWRRCASLGGYLVLEEYSFGTRTIYPYNRPQNLNPSISETFFCVPYKLGLKLGVGVVE